MVRPETATMIELQQGTAPVKPAIVIHLDRFWHGISVGADKLKSLKSYLDVRVVNYTKYETRRKRFAKVRYTRTSCFICNEKANHRHHIILLKHGGSNHSKNVIQLCRPCHNELHPWLVLNDFPKVKYAKKGKAPGHYRNCNGLRTPGNVSCQSE